MKQKLYIAITFSMCLLLCYSANCQLSEERKQELTKNVTLNSLFNCKYLSSEEKDFLKGIFYKFKEITNDPKSYDQLLMQVGDEATIERYVREFQTAGVVLGATPSASGQARFIEAFAPTMFRDEPFVYSGGDTPGPPQSYGITYAIIQLLRESPQLSPEVRHWALSLNLKEFEKNRALLQKWWKENEGRFKERNYQAVQPPAEQPTPSPVSGDSSPQSDGSARPPQTPPSAATSTDPEPSSLPALLLTILCATLLATALWLSSRRGKTPP